MSHNEFKTSEPIEPQETSPMEKKLSLVGIDIAQQVRSIYYTFCSA